jgi:hypothetical protein
VPLDDEVEAEFEDLVVTRAGVRVRQGIAGRRELVDEGSRHGDVDATEVRSERLHLDALRAGHGRRRHHIRDDGVGMDEVFWKTSLRRRRRQRSNDRAERRSGVRLQLRRDLLRLRPGEMEVAREDLADVLGREDVRELGDAGETQAPIPERRDDLRKLLHELRGPVPVEGGALRQTELADEEIEQRVVAELTPPALAIKSREGDQEVSERVMLAPKEVGEADGLFAGGRHDLTIARNFQRSGDASGSPLAQERAHPSRTPQADREHAQAATGRVPGARGVESAPRRRSPR